MFCIYLIFWVARQHSTPEERLAHIASTERWVHTCKGWNHTEVRLHKAQSGLFVCSTYMGCVHLPSAKAQCWCVYTCLPPTTDRLTPLLVRLACVSAHNCPTQVHN